MPVLLALDVGTSSARALAFEPGGRAVPAAQGQVPYAPRTDPDGAVELDAETVTRALEQAIDTCLAGLPAGTPVAAVGTSLFWHGLVPMDADGVALGPLMTWADTRAAGAADALRRALDGEAVRQRTGVPVHASFFPAKLRWLRQRDPAGFGRVRTWGGLGEYLLRRLFGRAALSLSMASGTGLLDRRTGAWDMPLLEMCGLGPDRLAPVDDAALAGLAAPWARRWPALARVPWFPPWGDGACSNVGSGCLDPSRVALNVGTSAAMRLVVSAPPPLPAGLWHYRIDAARHLVGGATSEGGNVAAWARELLAGTDGEALEREVAALPPDGHGLTVLPFLAGERSVGWHDRARGAVMGLSLATTRAALLRALLEAVALRLAALHQRLGPLAAPGHALVASGGALSRSPAWAQIVADALGTAVLLAREPEASARGAALLAAERLGHPLPVEPPAGDSVDPDPGRHGRYRAALARQERLYEIVVSPGES